MFKQFTIALLSMAVASAKTLECEADNDDACMSITRKSANGQLISLRPSEFAILELDTSDIQKSSGRMLSRGVRANATGPGGLKSTSTKSNNGRGHAFGRGNG